MSKRKAMSSDKAREVRQKGHDDVLEFALSIGLKSDYKNDVKAKKDVIDPSGDAHSVKSGKKRWQIFLYHKSRFEEDPAFQTMNGIGQLLIKCLEIFPDNYETYKLNKQDYKNHLQQFMIAIKDKLNEKRRLKSFLSKSLFNGGEVNYLTIKHEDKFHVFLNNDILDCFAANLSVENSVARKSNETSNQKVLFKFNNHNVGELEIRNSGSNHYREVLFVMNKLKVVDLLFSVFKNPKVFNKNVLVYGNAKRKFGNWQKL